MDTSQWPQQGIGVGERKARPEKDQAINCPRCNSTNTKFCYYNNYSLTQPRYFCKTCRRYWTEGGSLRNVPVGGGSRKNKRSTTSSTSSTTTTPSSSSSKKIATGHDDDHHQTSTIFPPPHSSSQNPKIHQGQDLNLAIFPPSDHAYRSNNISKFMEIPIPFNSNTKGDQLGENTSSSLSTMEFLKNNGISSRGLVTNSFMSMPNYANGFGLHELKVPTLNFSLQGFESGYHQEGVHGDHVQLQDTNNAISSNTTTNNGMFFSNEDLIKKRVNHPSANTSTDHEFEQDRGHADSTSYWNGILGGGSWLNQ